MGRRVLAWVPFILASIMGISALGGALLGRLGPRIMGLGLGIGAGIILYIVCEELLPESRKLWNGRMTTLAVLLGLLGGMFFLQ